MHLGPRGTDTWDAVVFRCLLLADALVLFFYFCAGMSGSHVSEEMTFITMLVLLVLGLFLLVVSPLASRIDRGWRIAGFLLSILSLLSLLLPTLARA
ncbi:MAG: hypothetical protein JWQ71_4743 [Pedosphaera sp.]|nr:hypothetical protein [Pedosphaera sp.]